MQRRSPAEWEPQAGVLIAWPHKGTDWSPRLDEVEAAYIRFALALARCEPVLVLVRDRHHQRHVHACLGDDLSRFHFAGADYDDTWIRDYGPLTVLEDRQARLMDFRFDGWGGKFDAGRDDKVTAALHRDGVFGNTPLEAVDFVLEGGAIDSDGAGSLLTTAAYWRARHPKLSRGEIAQRLQDWFGIERVIRLQHGRLEGDDTDAHVDTLARFCDPRTIGYQACDDASDGHHAPLQAMAEELAALRTRNGAPYRLIPLPWPGSIRDPDGRRLPASYANFLIVNGAVLVPTFDVSSDAEAVNRLQTAFPKRQVIGVPARALIWQNGSLHCAAMQFPESVNLSPLEATKTAP